MHSVHCNWPSVYRPRRFGGLHPNFPAFISIDVLRERLHRFFGRLVRQIAERQTVSLYACCGDIHACTSNRGAPTTAIAGASIIAAPGILLLYPRLVNMPFSASQLIALLLVALYTIQTDELVGESAELHKAGAPFRAQSRFP